MTHRVYAATDVQLVVAGVTDAKCRDQDMLSFLTSARVGMSMNKQANVHKEAMNRMWMLQRSVKAPLGSYLPAAAQNGESVEASNAQQAAVTMLFCAALVVLDA